LLTDQIQYIVLDLEGDADLPEDISEQVEFSRSGVAGGHGPEPTRTLAGVPARFLRHHVDVVVVDRGHLSAPDPAKLDRLTLERLATHTDYLGDHGERACEP